jgi:hypothetical protein
MQVQFRNFYLILWCQILYVFNIQCDAQNADWWIITVCVYAAAVQILVFWRSLQEFFSGPEGLRVL